MNGARAKALRKLGGGTVPNPGRRHGGSIKAGAERKHMPSPSYDDMKTTRSRADRRQRKSGGRWAGPV